MLDRRQNAKPVRGLRVLALILFLIPVDAAIFAEGTGSGRVVAIGDIHGAYDGLVEILREAELIDESHRWIGGGATLVQTGDLVDRGPEIRQVMDLMMSLQRQAAEQGGQVIVLMGNHESMALIGDVQDASPQILASFASEDAEKLRREGWKTFVKWMNQMARSRGGANLDLNEEKKAQWMTEHPPGYFEYMQAMGPEGEYGKWIMQMPVVTKIGDTIFMHAGISPQYMEMSLDEINELHWQEIGTFVENREQLAKQKVIPWFYNLYEINQALVYQSQNPPLEEYRNSKQAKLIAKAAADLNRMQAILLQDSPLWYRGYTNLGEAELEQHLDDLEKAYGAHRFVVAHSPMATGSIQERLDGRVFLIDTGMLAAYYKGRPSALEIDQGTFSALYPAGERQVLVKPENDMVPASAAANNNAELRAPQPQLAVFRSSHQGRFTTVAYPPQEGAGADMHKRVWRDPLGNPLPFETREELEQFLATAEVVSQQKIPKGVTKPKKLLLEKDGVQVHAKFNYVNKSGQREKMADGTVEMYFLDSYKSDLAAYELSKLLGMESVPPGVARDVDGEDGIVQLWVEGLNTYENWLQEEGNTGTPASTYFDRQLKDMYTFDLLIRNTDRNQGNIAWDADTNLWLIDHTRSMARDKGLRDPKSFKGCSVQLYDAMKALKEKDVKQAISPYLGEFEIKALMQRRDKLIKLIDQEIKKEGRDEVIFDYTAPPKGMVISYDEAAA